MTFDDLKIKTMKDHPDEKSNGKKAKGLPFLYSPWWCPVAVTLGVLCLGSVVIIIKLGVELSQVSDLLTQQQANLTHQKNKLERQISARQQAEEASQESQKELKEIIETLAQKLNEKSKEQMELHQQNLNLQETLKRAANCSAPCPQDWIWHKESCYLFSSGSLDWKKSQENCLSLDAKLLKINSTADLDFILQAASHSSFPFWIGLSRRNPHYPWLWEDGSPLMPYLFRLRGAISQTYSLGTCAYIQQGTVFAENCALVAFRICQKKANLLRAQ
ncbi:oxidized low-density lipoprotein receptor 1 isoform X1 [Cebus imitator]|uniref:Oxidized low-density lipoprotein receptor 1 n=2 Tax=Cebinae TaxID=38070 RepID=A0A2K5PJE3_CEBIM|nr:oxidized low-density lipoprotein receptor 1 isoform X1 [Cebus imitator]XP_032110245.1 oxidized low-density lipoprotein receptor 1 isoform X1 [Sapajus apella]